VAAGSGLRLDAFEQYIRGITEPDQQERLRHLNHSVLLSPQFSPAWMALGREEFAGQKYEQAAEAFAKAGGNDADAHEASFFRGLSLLFSGDYAHAEEAFASVARVLPLAEVLNNQGVALARQGKDGTPLFRQAVDADPNDADYHFSLAVSLKRHGGYDAEAMTELAQCLRLRPTDIEAQAVQKAWTSPRPAATGAVKTPAAQPAAGSRDSDEAEEEAEAKADPLERIQRTFDEVAFRQAALMLDQINSARRSALPPRERVQDLTGQAHEYLGHGLLLEAERLYLAALAIDPKAVMAHAGLAEIRERTGDTKAARKEAVTSLELLPSVDAYLVLVRLDLAVNHLEEAKQNVEAALRIDPQSKPALELRRQIAVKGGLKK
jgi:tetratricopeptide (TPR) repeat protein